MWHELQNFSLQNIPEVLVLAFLIFAVLTFLRGTRGEGMLKILGFCLAVGYIVLRWLAIGLEAERLTLVLDAIFQASVIALVVIFQPEMRRGLALKIGSRFFTGSLPEREIVEEVVNAVTRLAKTRIGALIALEREDSLKEYANTGTPIDSEVKAELLRTIFYVGTPLHDGAVIIQGGRLAAAGCFLPLTDNPSIPKSLGTRHRAGIGLSEAEDALVAIVSEETGGISLAVGGNIHRDLDREGLVGLLEQFYLTPLEQDEEGAEAKESEAPEKGKKGTGRSKPPGPPKQASSRPPKASSSAPAKIPSDTGPVPPPASGEQSTSGTGKSARPAKAVPS